MEQAHNTDISLCVYLIQYGRKKVLNFQKNQGRIAYSIKGVLNDTVVIY